MKHFPNSAHLKVMNPKCPRCVGGRVMWENDALFPISFFGYTGTCLACGFKAHTQDLLAPNDPADYVRDDGSLPDSDRYLSVWKKLMEVKEDAA